MVSIVASLADYAGREGQSLVTEGEVWVTAAPELQKRCIEPGWTRGDLPQRLRQVVGLTPTSPVAGVVEFWVDTADLFRPAANPDITTTQVGLTMPASVSAEHREWFNRLRAHQYFQSEDPVNEAYPWTQLGYTCDWGQGGDPCAQGLSEFVIRRESAVTIHTVVSPEAYCAY